MKKRRAPRPAAAVEAPPQYDDVISNLPLTPPPLVPVKQRQQQPQQRGPVSLSSAASSACSSSADTSCGGLSTTSSSSNVDASFNYHRPTPCIRTFSQVSPEHLRQVRAFDALLAEIDQVRRDSENKAVQRRLWREESYRGGSSAPPPSAAAPPPSASCSAVPEPAQRVAPQPVGQKRSVSAAQHARGDVSWVPRSNVIPPGRKSAVSAERHSRPSAAKGRRFERQATEPVRRRSVAKAPSPSPSAVTNAFEQSRTYSRHSTYTAGKVESQQELLRHVGGASPDPAMWTVDQVASYLKGVNLDSEFVTVLRKHRVNGLCFLSLTREELVRELGISQFSALKTIAAVQMQLRGGRPSSSKLRRNFNNRSGTSSRHLAPNAC